MLLGQRTQRGRAFKADRVGGRRRSRRTDADRTGKPNEGKRHCCVATMNERVETEQCRAFLDHRNSAKVAKVARVTKVTKVIGPASKNSDQRLGMRGAGVSRAGLPRIWFHRDPACGAARAIVEQSPHWIRRTTAESDQEDYLPVERQRFCASFVMACVPFVRAASSPSMHQSMRVAIPSSARLFPVNLKDSPQ